MKRALITGVYGQDGSYLCEVLHQDNYEIHGVCRNTLSETAKKNKKELEKESICIAECHISLYDYTTVSKTIREIRPDVIFHMAAIHRASSCLGNNNLLAEKELYEKNVLATNNILTACYEESPNTRVVSAGSCLVFDDCLVDVQDECIPFSSQSMYGIAKIAENNLVRLYRKKGLFACTPILYNHESHRRSPDFVTKKIVNSLKEIKEGKRDYLELGDISVKKDWGFAGDYAMAMKLICEASDPQDYIIATGELHSIEEYISLCAKELQMNDWRKYLKMNDRLITRRVSNNLCGNSQKCVNELGWKRSIDFMGLVKEMIR